MRRPHITSCAACGRSNEKNGYVRGLCRKCYQRKKNTGSTSAPIRKTSDQRFWEKVDKSSECWVWTAYTNPAGYGQFGEGKKIHLAHRWIYERERGPIPDGLTIDHLCRNTACVRVDHLESVSLQENAARTTGYKFSHYARGDREMCGNGHEMTAENSYQRPGRVNSFACRKCMAQYQRAYELRKGLRDEQRTV